MDFNYFYHRQQVSLMRAKAATGPARSAHEALAIRYWTLIARGRAERGAGPATLSAPTGCTPC